MSVRRLVILSVVVVLLFAFILLVERKMPSTEDRKQQGELLWDLPEDRIDEIHLEHSGTPIRLKKEGEAWKILQPEPYPADSVAVSDLTTQLGNLKRAEGEATGGKAEDYGLSPPAAKAVVFWTDEKAGSARQKKTLELGIEIPGTDITAARIEGSGTVVFVPTSVAAAVRKGLQDLKSKEVFGGSAFDVARLDIERGRGRLTLAKKGGAWWLEQPLADLASTETADELAGELSGLRVQEFVGSPERDNLATIGLDRPLYRVTVTDSKNKSVTVTLGATRAQGSAIYGRRDGQVFTLDNAVVENLTREAVAFRSSQLVRFDRADVAAIRGRFGAASYALEQKDGGWRQAGKPVLASAVDDLLTALLDLKSRGFLEGAAASGQPAAEIGITLTNKQQWDVRIYPRGAGFVAVVGGRPGAFELPEDALTRLQEAFRKASQTPAPTPAATPTVRKP